ncbi:hypothetical protein XPR_2461 [Xanthomonas arboricola pv. pruni MAFF 301420]|uniref:Uncharacterized protein n=2 Tax=Xanthomonas arboricola pv. pruni TaxID=69929 RepID=W4SH08_9XANT|nr:hypothetical protein XPU_2415 [Xanthomonas arboricola pv. pruni str. MAFF 311562]GAE55826.1 hypothetical protein XPR_2461 [Xanthomonas arboricola pv. pruni MAFF 301420]GAE59537.1 hypothetical protein XPN_1443 [Xanthomonas arboricola pv. pruni MAFF 301427]
MAPLSTYPEADVFVRQRGVPRQAPRWLYSLPDLWRLCIRPCYPAWLRTRNAVRLQHQGEVSPARLLDDFYDTTSGVERLAL